MVAFSRSMRPMEPISLEMEVWTSSPITSRHSRAISNSWSLRMVENTLAMAMDCTFPFIRSRKARAASTSSGASSFPSNSKPPRMTMESSTTAWMSSGQSTMGGMPVVAGAPMRIRPTFARCLRSTMALVHWVVPSMAWVISLRSTPEFCSTVRMARRIPS